MAGAEAARSARMGEEQPLAPWFSTGKTSKVVKSQRERASRLGRTSVGAASTGANGGEEASGGGSPTASDAAGVRRLTASSKSSTAGGTPRSPSEKDGSPRLAESPAEDERDEEIRLLRQELEWLRARSNTVETHARELEDAKLRQELEEQRAKAAAAEARTRELEEQLEEQQETRQAEAKSKAQAFEDELRKRLLEVEDKMKRANAIEAKAKAALEQAERATAQARLERASAGRPEPSLEKVATAPAAIKLKQPEPDYLAILERKQLMQEASGRSVILAKYGDKAPVIQEALKRLYGLRCQVVGFLPALFWLHCLGEQNIDWGQWQMWLEWLRATWYPEFTGDISHIANSQVAATLDRLAGPAQA